MKQEGKSPYCNYIIKESRKYLHQGMQSVNNEREIFASPSMDSCCEFRLKTAKTGWNCRLLIFEVGTVSG